MRFELDVVEGEGHDGQTADGHGEATVLGAAVHERFAGFFELPGRCVPFETPASFGEESSSENGFPAVVDLGVDAMPDPKEPTGGTVLRQRHKGKSFFAQHFDRISQKKSSGEGKDEAAEGTKAEEGIVDRNVKNLELMPTPDSKGRPPNRTTNTAVDHCAAGRFAIDPVHSDFAVKCMRHVVSRHEQQLVKLFDTLAATESFDSLANDENSHSILEQAKRNIELIRSLYLEQIRTEESGRVVWQFERRFANPFSGAWTLGPIRNVLDAVQQRNSAIATPDDIEIVRLALLWTVSFFLQRPVYFGASVSISEFFCRLAEIYLLGPEMFLYDQQIRNCVSLLINKFVINACQKGKMAIRLNEPIAALDQFMPFYEDLLQQFENVSAGDENFALLLLIGAYLNASRVDGLLMAQTLWSPKRNVVRQIILPEERARPFISFGFVGDRSLRSEGTSEDQCRTNEAIRKLVENYVCALREGIVVEGRNGAVFALAVAELKQFIGQNEVEEKSGEVPDQLLKDVHETLSRLSS